MGAGLAVEEAALSGEDGAFLLLDNACFGDPGRCGSRPSTNTTTASTIRPPNVRLLKRSLSDGCCFCLSGTNGLAPLADPEFWPSTPASVFCSATVEASFGPFASIRL